MAYDRTYDALFNPGRATDLFRFHRQISFESECLEYCHGNAWWLAECSRLAYVLDDLRQCKQPHGGHDDIEQLLAEIGLRLLEVIYDPTTSACAAVLEATTTSGPEAARMRIVAFCGSNEALDWKMNFQAGQVDFADFGRVHAGFSKSLNSVASRVITVASAGANRLFLTGHSLGAALATLLAVELCRQPTPPFACYSFGSPRIGNRRFVDTVSKLPVYRAVNNTDLVTTVPVSWGTIEYLHPDNAIFLSQDGCVEEGITDAAIQRHQSALFPSLKNLLDDRQLLARMKGLPAELPETLADHSIVNYSNRLAARLGV